MASRKGNPVHGWVILDKPIGLTSSRAVGIVRRIFTAAKAGHGGTLDPLASGLLPIALGEATKTVSFAMDGAKSYEVTISFGRQTTTDDREGEAVATSETRPDAAAIEAVLPRFTGTVMQRPPIFSAIKIDGARAYDIARKAVADGLETLPELAPRPVEIERLELRATTPDSATLLVACGKGTYIRSLARDMALALGTVGHVGHLRRLSVGPFSEADAISLAFLEELEHKDAAFEHLKPVTSVLDDIPALPVSAGEAAKLRHGQTLPALGPSAETRVADLADRGTGVALLGDQPVALVTVKAGKIQPLRVFNL
ncbi:MAG: tRNA pseudouridine(55) synthase TruB [Pseudomonadota bacterium]|nr:tRNA pseudouridine(55) synthase TruB [Pseudomonadota bacterium]